LYLVDALNAGADFQAMCQWFYLRENGELREKMQVLHAIEQLASVREKRR
jgi:hypothetical protein